MRRIKYLHFQPVPVDKLVDQFFETRLRQELPGIINRVIRFGGQGYHNGGFVTTDKDKELLRELDGRNSVSGFWQQKIDEIRELVANSNNFDRDKIAFKDIFDSRTMDFEYIDFTAVYREYTKYCQDYGQGQNSFQNFCADSKRYLDRWIGEEIPGARVTWYSAEARGLTGVRKKVSALAIDNGLKIMEWMVRNSPKPATK